MHSPVSANFRWLVLGVSSRLGGAGQRLGVDILPNLRQFAFWNSNVENPVVPERLIGGLDFPRGDADGQNPVPLRHEFGRLWVSHFHLFSCLPKRSRQSRVPAVRTGQRPALAWNDPLNVFGGQS